MSLLAALDEALTEVELQPADAAVVALARRYAGDLDGRGHLSTVGPALLRALEELRMTPRARATMRKEMPHVQPSALDELKRKRAARIADTPALDSAPA